MLIQMISPNLGLPKYDDSNYNEIRTEYLARYIRNKQTGEPLQGEIHMFKRICEDCHQSSLPWFCFHGLTFDSSPKSNFRKMIEIDFLLLSPKGAIVVEVKGGGIKLQNGQYILSRGSQERLLEESPFEQAENAKFFLLNWTHLLKNEPFFVTTCCAFPHSNLNKTSDDIDIDLGWKIWSKPREDNKENFADFCLDVIEKSKNISSKRFPDFLENQILKIANHIAPSINPLKAEENEIRWQDVIKWLKINNEDTLRSLRKNDRIVIEGGPGTGKTTIAKEYIFLNSEKKGIYFCWNKLLKSSIEHKLAQKGLSNCRVEQFLSYLLSLDPNGELINFENFDKLSYTDLCFYIACLVDEQRNSNPLFGFDYVIVDEAQDILDKGVLELIKNLTCSNGKIESSKFLIFYDNDQEYDERNRKSEQYISSIASTTAQFVLTENRRVSSTKEIVCFAQTILRGCDLLDAYKNFAHSEYISLEEIHAHKHLVKKINAIRQESTIKDDIVLLLDSNCKWTNSSTNESLYQRISGLDSVVEIDEKNIKLMEEIKKIPFCSILQYKGLENKRVILVIGKRTYQNKSYELYVGVTRAIINVEIWLYGEC